jgi:hydroxymethylbilane synthase
MIETLKIGTRKSPLALWQAHYVKDRLQQLNTELDVQLVEIVSSGDKHLETALAKIGGKGLFLKELENALLDGSVDIAVHSMKDVTVELPIGLHIPVICEREDPTDAFVSNHYNSLADLPNGAKVGTCSLRRKSQIAACFPQLELIDLRGNVNTRLKRLDDGDFEAIILASAGLMRLGLDERIKQRMAIDEILPAVGQGAVGIECRENDDRINALIKPLNCDATMIRVTAERAANKVLGGGCHVPVAAFAQLQGDKLSLQALVGSVDGKTILSCEHQGNRASPVKLGEIAARDLIEQGANGILATVYRELGGD